MKSHRGEESPRDDWEIKTNLIGQNRKQIQVNGILQLYYS